MGPTLQRKFDILTQIHRASHFEWLGAIKAICPEVNERELVLRFWADAGHDTARSYVKHIDPSQPLPRQIAANIVFSSVCMGEDAVLVEGIDDQEAFVRHSACPWFEWHVRTGRTDDDQPGCDMWIGTLVADINRELASEIEWETISSLPQGDEVCLRRFWLE